ncbi:hypothetical protein FC90_GL000133 [Latilactobacillus graminis DSM 20719]|uniref:Uncharacterized protein n=1 Tax=Latilactobacillus graminis DSM 20719 TaxID=1423752 RepID=A0AA89HZJ1_9LACO|nr:hypothetical protein FC90_GL000133 [Latilactobacillus graminis DSM 20719]
MKVKMDKKNSNLEKQRTAAIGFIRVQSGVEKIEFLKDGFNSGSGIWSISVNTIVDGKKYEEILNEDGLDGGDPLPDGNTGTAKPVEVIYSNGRREILK